MWQAGGSRGAAGAAGPGLPCPAASPCRGSGSGRQQQPRQPGAHPAPEHSPLTRVDRGDLVPQAAPPAVQRALRPHQRILALRGRGGAPGGGDASGRPAVAPRTPATLRRRMAAPSRPGARAPSQPRPRPHVRAPQVHLVLIGRQQPGGVGRPRLLLQGGQQRRRQTGRRLKWARAALRHCTPAGPRPTGPAASQ